MGGQTLSQEKIDNIIEEWKKQDAELPDGDEPTITDVAEEVPHSKSTVSKYIKQWKNEYDPGESERGGDGDDEFTAAPPSSPTGSGPKDDGPEFASMSYGDFIKWFFNQDGFGVRSAFANTLARQCDVRGKIPDRPELANAILNGNSGISNGYQADSLSEVYWDAAQRFLRAKGDMAPGGGDGRQVQTVGGSWTNEQRPDGADGQQPAERGGEWVGPQEAASGPAGRGAPQQHGNNHQGRGSRPNGGVQGQQIQDQQYDRGAGPGAGPGRGGQGPPQRDPELIEAIGELRDTQELLMRRLSQSEGQNPNDLKSQAEQLAEARRAMEDAFDSGSNDAVSELRQDLRALREEINQVAQSAGEEIDISGDENGLGALVKLATETDMSEDKIATLAETMGMSDPEVEKEKYRFRREEERARNRREMVNDFIDAFGDAGGDILASAFESFRESRRERRRDPPEAGPPRRGEEEPRYDAVERVTERRGDARREPSEPRNDPALEDRKPPAKRLREESQGGGEVASVESAEPADDDPEEGKTDSLEEPDSIMSVENDVPEDGQ